MKFRGQSQILKTSSPRYVIINVKCSQSNLTFSYVVEFYHWCRKGLLRYCIIKTVFQCVSMLSLLYGLPEYFLKKIEEILWWFCPCSCCKWIRFCSLQIVRTTRVKVRILAF